MNIASLVEAKTNPNIPKLAPGDTVKVHTKIVEAEKERIQIFQGTVIKLKNTKTGVNFTVRHVAYGVGVERTFPSNSPLVEKVEVLRHGKVRRAKLYYLRALSGKASRIKERRLEKGLVEEEAAQEPMAAEPPSAEQPTEQPTPAAQEPVSQPEAQAQPAPEVQKPAAQPPAEGKASQPAEGQKQPEEPKA